MRIAYYNRPDNNTVFGGDLVQMNNTAQKLGELYSADITDFSQRTPEELIAWKPDIVHAFAVHPSTYKFLREVKLKSDIPIVLSTIYISLSQLYWAQGYIYETFSQKNYSLLNDLKKRVGIRRDLTNGMPYAETFSMVDGWLPNGVGELYDIRHDFNVATKPFAIVPNSVGEQFFTASNYEDDEDIEMLRNYGKPFVVTVGRVESRKNQIMLLHALKNTGIPVLIIGQSSDTYYYDMCKETNGFLYIDHMEHDKLRKIYEMENCVYALPSWLESPSLASMEALVSGCPIVVGNQGTEYEYFGNYANYVDPADYENIAKTIQYVIENRRSIRERNKPFSEIARNKYTWDETARITYNFYREILTDRK